MRKGVEYLDVGTAGIGTEGRKSGNLLLSSSSPFRRSRRVVVWAMGLLPHRVVLPSVHMFGKRLSS
jgi:hypothetical protein